MLAVLNEQCFLLVVIMLKAAQTSSFVAFVTGSINSLRTFLLLPKAVDPLISDCGDRTLHGATGNLCLCLFMWKRSIKIKALKAMALGDFIF